MEKKKGPAPPPPSLPNQAAVTVPKESTDEKVIPDTIEESEKIENMPNENETSESPIITTPDEISSPPEVNLIKSNKKNFLAKL